MDNFQFFFLLEASSQRVMYYHGINVDGNNEAASLDNLMDFTVSLVHFFLNFSFSDLKSIEMNVCRITLVQRDAYLFGLMSGFSVPVLDAEFKLKTIVSLLLSEKTKFFSADGKELQAAEEVTRLVEQVLLGAVVELTEKNKEDIRRLLKHWKSNLELNKKVSVSVLSFSGTVLVGETVDETVIQNAQEIIGIIHSEGIIEMEYFILAMRLGSLIIHRVNSGVVLLVEVRDALSFTEERKFIEFLKDLSVQVNAKIANQEVEA